MWHSWQQFLSDGVLFKLDLTVPFENLELMVGLEDQSVLLNSLDNDLNPLVEGIESTIHNLNGSSRTILELLGQLVVSIGELSNHGLNE